MADGARARLMIVSRMTDETGGTQTIKHARLGEVCETETSLTLCYEDEQDGERAHVTLTEEGGVASMRRRGMTRAELRFAPGERCAAAYETPYGALPVAVYTRRVSCEHTAAGGELRLDYDVFIAGERTAKTVLTVAWRR